MNSNDKELDNRVVDFNNTLILAKNIYYTGPPLCRLFECLINEFFYNYFTLIYCEIRCLRATTGGRITEKGNIVKLNPATSGEGM